MFNDYIIADSGLRLSGSKCDLVALGLPSFAPFQAEASSEREITVEVSTDCDISLDGVEMELLTEFDFAEGEALCRFLRSAEYYIFTLGNAHNDEHIFRCRRDDCRYVSSNIALVNVNVSFVRFGIWFMLNMASVQHQRVAIHSSVIVCRDEAVMFLGESGTGKSTHTRLWRETIAGATLLNDDSPFVGMRDGRLHAYGSPWSGKTPCYRDESYPVRAIVRLSQAPYNAIHRLRGVRAIGALLPSLPPAFAFDAELEDATLAALSQIVANVAVYHLECLPDAAAARLSHDTVYGGVEGAE